MGPWCDSQHDVFILRRLVCFMMHTAFRLAEIVGNGSSEIMYLTLDCLTWRINGVFVKRPTLAQLASLRSGRDVAFVTPPRSKPDQWGETHCPFPVVLTFNDTDPINAAAKLRDLERRYGVDCADRSATPLFATATGTTYTHHHLHNLLRTLLSAMYSPATASLYSFHSFRSGLATALHAANVDDARIMLICRWMCPESLHVYRRMGTAEHETLIQQAARSNIDAIQTPNIVRVVGDQGYADLAHQFATVGHMARDAYNAALQGMDAEAPAAPPAPRAAPARDAAPNATAPPPAPAPAPPPPQLLPVNARPVRGDELVVPATIWPQYRCRELGGAGWLVRVVSVSSANVVVRFLHATTRAGAPYHNERLSWQQLQRLQVPTQPSQ